jgi:hypothetical protein
MKAFIRMSPQLRICLNEAEELIAMQLEDFARFAHTQSGNRPAASEDVRFAGELTCAKRDDRRLALARLAQSLNLPAEDDEERQASVTDVHQHISACDWTPATERGDARKMRIGELREEFVLIHWCLGLVSILTRLLAMARYNSFQREPACHPHSNGRSSRRSSGRV